MLAHTLNHIHAALLRDELEEALNGLLALEDAPHQAELLMLAGRLSAYQAALGSGTLSTPEAQLERSRIRKALGQFLFKIAKSHEIEIHAKSLSDSAPTSQFQPWWAWMAVFAFSILGTGIYLRFAPEPAPSSELAPCEQRVSFTLPLADIYEDPNENQVFLLTLANHLKNDPTLSKEIHPYRLAKNIDHLDEKLRDTLNTLISQKCIEKGIIVYSSHLAFEGNPLFCYFHLVNLEIPKIKFGHTQLSYTRLKSPETLNFELIEEAQIIGDFVIALLRLYQGDPYASTLFSTLRQHPKLSPNSSLKPLCSLYEGHAAVLSGEWEKADSVYQHLAKNMKPNALGMDIAEVKWNHALVQFQLQKPQAAIKSLGEYLSIHPSTSATEDSILFLIASQVLKDTDKEALLRPLHTWPKYASLLSKEKASSHSIPEPVTTQPSKTLNTEVDTLDSLAQSIEEAVIARSPIEQESQEETPPIAAPNMIFIQGGIFQMGNPLGKVDEQYQHPVAVSDFYLAEAEVSNEQYCVFLNEKGNQTYEENAWIDLQINPYITQQADRFVPKAAFAQHPVSGVSWQGAQAYCQWLGQGYRLPTEAEWEYVAQTGRTSLVSASQLRNYGNFASQGAKDQFIATAPVKSFPPNTLGIYDLSGNVWEWCQDWYERDYYTRSPHQDPLGPPQGYVRVIRGGSWCSAPHLYAYDRQACKPERARMDVGFRPARRHPSQ